MYPMPEFQERDSTAILDFIRKYPFGMLTGIGEIGHVVATHVPFLVDAEGDRIRLRAHVMRKTEYWKGFKANPNVLVAFTGPDASVLESWNENRPFGGTWNYMAVHVRGLLNFLPQEGLLQILRELKNLHEDDTAVKFESLSQDYLDALVPAIEGFEIAVEDVQAVFKLSQNRSRTDFDSTIRALQERGGESALVAEEMAARASIFFPT